MKTTFKTKVFSHAFGIARSVFSPKDVQVIQIDASASMTTQMGASGSGVSVRIPLECTVLEEGSVFISVEQIKSLLAKTKCDSFTFSTANSGFIFEGDDNSCHAFGDVDYQSPAKWDTARISGDFLEVSPSDLLQAIKNVSISVGKDGEIDNMLLSNVCFTVPPLSGQYTGKCALNLVATDRRVMSWQKVTCDLLGSPVVDHLVPFTALKTLSKMLSGKSTGNPVVVFFYEDEVFFHTGNSFLRVVPSKGRYPEWKKILPDGKKLTQCIVIDNVPALLNAFKSFTPHEDDDRVDVEFKDGNLTLLGKTEADNVSIPAVGNMEMRIQVKSERLLPFLKILDKETVLHVCIPECKEAAPRCLLRPVVKDEEDGLLYIMLLPDQPVITQNEQDADESNQDTDESACEQDSDEEPDSDEDGN